MREKVFVFLIAIFLLGSLTPTFYEIARSDRLPGVREFELVHNFPTDFNFYLSRVRQGIEGNVTVREQYTSEPHQGSFIHILYLFLGWLGRWTRTPWHRAADVYHVARVVFGGLLLVMIAEFCKKAFSSERAEVARPNARVLRSLADARAPSAQGSHLSELPARFPFSFSLFSFSILAFLLAVTASTWPKLVAYVNNQVVPATIANITNWRFGGFMSWWSVMDSLQRNTFIPHLLVGQALIIFLIMALSDETTMRKPGNWVFLGVLAFIEGIIFPPGLLFIIVVISFLGCFNLLFSINHANLLPTGGKLTWFFSGWVLPRFVVILLGLPSLVYLSLMTSFYPWKRLAEFDIIKPLPFNYTEYLLAVGPILPIGIIGLFIVLWKREKALFPAVAWILAWALLLFIFQFIPAQSPLRFSEMTPHVPLGVLTAYLFYVVQNRSGFAFFRDAQGSDKRLIMPSRPSLSETSPPQHLMGSGSLLRRSFSAFQNANPRVFLTLFTFHFSLFTAIALIAIGLGVMYSSFLWQRDFVDHKMRAAYPLVPTGSYVMYPLKDFIAAMKYVQDATSRDSVILSETTAGNYIPVQAGNTVYVGHANTVNAEEKEATVQAFFAGRMKPDEARDWLERENLHWIFFGPQEKEDGLSAQAGGVSDLTKVYPFLQQAYKNTFVIIYRLP